MPAELLLEQGVYIPGVWLCFLHPTMKPPHKPKFRVIEDETEIFSKVFTQKILVPIKKENKRTLFIKKLNKKVRPIPFTKGK